MAVNLEVVYEHIRACLKVGDRKLQSAKLLKEKKRFEDAVSPYVKAYEELGQAFFLKKVTLKIPKLVKMTGTCWSDLVLILQRLSHITLV